MLPAPMIRTLFLVSNKINRMHFVKSVSSFMFNNNSVHIQSKNLLVLHRLMAHSSITNIDIEELKKYQNNQVATIIDVRENDEIKETGVLPGAFHIPWEISKALQEDPNAFKKKYNHDKPIKDRPIIFSCRSGKRSLMAAQTAESLGYKNAVNFTGGWLAWESHLPK